MLYFPFFRIVPLISRKPDDPLNKKNCEIDEVLSMQYDNRSQTCVAICKVAKFHARSCNQWLTMQHADMQELDSQLLCIVNYFAYI